METVKLEKKELLVVLKQNRTDHRKIFEEALEGFRVKAIEYLEKRLEAAKAGQKFGLQFDLIQPEDHTKDYDRIIRMLEMSTDAVVEMTQHEFSMYVQDEWLWQRNWLHSNSAYTASAVSKLNSMEA